MDEINLQKFAEDNWARVPEDKRRQCVQHLRQLLADDEKAALREDFEDGKFNAFFHFSSGMAVRNALREIMTDDELPGIEYPGGRGHKYQNWDDFYMAALRQAVAPKEDEA